jgi:hypothetical protein
MKKFFSKAHRPTKDEQKWRGMIEELVKKEPLLESVLEEQETVKDVQGLRKIYDVLLKNSSSAPATPTSPKTESMATPEEKASIPFETMIDIERDSQFAQPVADRENLAMDDGLSAEDTEFTMQGDDQGSEGSGGDNEPYEEAQEHGDGGSPTSDMSPEEKRKSIKSTAKLVSRIYQDMLPIVPRWVARFPEAKMQKMAWADEIDPNMVLDTTDGKEVILSSYVQDYNNTVNNVIGITDAMKDEFQVALEAVMSEKEVAMTPTQQLVVTVVSHTVAMVGQAIQLKMTMNSNMEDFKKFHADKKAERERDNNANNGRNNNGGQEQATQKTTPTPPKPPVQETRQQPVKEEQESLIEIKPEDIIDP